MPLQQAHGPVSPRAQHPPLVRQLPPVRRLRSQVRLPLLLPAPPRGSVGAQRPRRALQWTRRVRAPPRRGTGWRDAFQNESA